MRRIIHHVAYHAKKHGKAVHKHIRKHHKKYIFGAISSALVYKTLALIITAAAINPTGITFASGAIDTGTEYTGIVMTGDFVVNNDDSSTTGLDVTINNNIDGATHMRFGNTESDRNIAAWDTYSDTKAWTLDDNGTGTKTVYAQFSGNNISGENIILDLQDDINYLPETQANTGSSNTGGNNSGNFVADITPDTVDFTDITGANLTTEYFSDTIDILGVNTGVEISINSSSNGSYSINGNTRTNTNSIVNSGDTVQVKLFSADDNSTKKTAILSIGDLDIDWSITTTGVAIEDTGSTQTGETNTGTESNSNQICDAQDINLLNPLSGDIIRGEFNINREYNNTDCDGDSFTIKLRDANNQYVTLGTVDYSRGENSIFNFDSSLLYSGFYNIYSGVDLSGNDLLIYTGQYSGLNTKYFSGYKIAILNSDNVIMYEGDEFTIDNLKPEIVDVSLTSSEVNDNHVGLGTTIDLEFNSSEELSGVLVNILGVYATLESHTANHYKYTLDLSTDNTEGNIIYNIEFEDLAGNTGYVEGNDTSIIFDKTKPALDVFNFTNTGDNIHIDIDTNEDTKVKFIYNLSGSNTGGTYEGDYSEQHNYDFSGIDLDQDYNYTLSLEDYAKNITYIGGVFNFSGGDIKYTDDLINSEDMIVDIGFSTGATQTTTGDTSTGSVSTGSATTTFLGEINKFKECKDSLVNVSTLEIPVRNYKAKIQMPELETAYVRKLVSAFSIVLFDRIEKGGLSHEGIDKITKEFNNFLVIIKLVRDDENDCEQNLSNYYMSKFKDSLIKYNLVE